MLAFLATGSQPGLVAFVSWIADNRALAEEALAEAIKRDDSKASLFFSLVCRQREAHGSLCAVANAVLPDPESGGHGSGSCCDAGRPG